MSRLKTNGKNCPLLSPFTHTFHLDQLVGCAACTGTVLSTCSHPKGHFHVSCSLQSKRTQILTPKRTPVSPESQTTFKQPGLGSADLPRGQDSTCTHSRPSQVPNPHAHCWSHMGQQEKGLAAVVLHSSRPCGARVPPLTHDDGGTIRRIPGTVGRIAALHRIEFLTHVTLQCSWKENKTALSLVPSEGRPQALFSREHQTGGPRLFRAPRPPRPKPGACIHRVCHPDPQCGRGRVPCTLHRNPTTTRTHAPASHVLL